MVPDGDGLDEGQEVMAMLLNNENLNGREWRN
jgi:hypothetical protein